MIAGKSSVAARLRWVACGIALAVLASSARAQPAEPEPRGRRLYREGLGTDNRPLTAVNRESGVALPPAFVACAHCHGYDGRGKTEAGVTAADIRGVALEKNYSTSPTGNRPRPPYDESTFLSALTRGLDPGGRALHPAMPRYRLTADDATALFAYLKTGIAQVTDEGVTDDALQIGYLPSSSPTSASEAGFDQQFLSAWFDDINQSGGIYRRRIVLRRLEPASPSLGAQPLLAVFASDEATVDGTGNLPILRVHSASFAKVRPSEFALYPGVADRSRALLRHALAQSPANSSRVALLHDANPAATAAASALSSILDSLAPLQLAPLSPANAESTVARLRAAGITTILFLSGPESIEPFLVSAQNLGWAPLQLWPSRPTLDSALTSPALTLQPARDTDVTPQALSNHREWTARHGLPSHDLPRQLALVALAQTLVESLKSTGHELSRDRLRDALESLRDFRTGLTPPLSFTPTRHTALSGVYVVPVNGPRDTDPSWIALDR